MSMNGEPLVVLHVEDNKDHADLVIRAFKKHRVVNKLYLVEDGEEALEKKRNHFSENGVRTIDRIIRPNRSSSGT